MLNWLRRRKEAGEPNPEAVPSLTGPIALLPEPPQTGDYLMFTDTDGRALYAPLDRPTLVLGSDPQCDIVLDARLPGAGRTAPHHARIERWHNRWVLVPLSLDAPVFVNGKRAGETVLKDGMTIQLGHDGVCCTVHIRPSE
ncbi:hypothetical protein HRbin17_00918 [bacterium HR17]|uniref:FHA domain-containing protein n=1 Tax=Candidatus Fervidibacter japonicus TaxID=2035412 RepID=A0A2H5XB35_9BACT|nr:hypothetical protein HRbin17_00918 [bacterium HR17]